MLPTEPAPQPPPAAAPPPAGNRPGLLGTIVETARETGRAVLREEAVGPLLEVLLAKLCSAPVRQAIEQHAAEALHAALQASVEVLPEDARGGALDAQLARAEDTARRLLADSLAEAFSPAAGMEPSGPTRHHRGDSARDGAHGAACGSRGPAARGAAR